MIKVLIIEDEIPARKKLRRFISELHAEIRIVAEIETVSAGIDFLKRHSVDLIFSDRTPGGERFRHIQPGFGYLSGYLHHGV